MQISASQAVMLFSAVIYFFIQYFFHILYLLLAARTLVHEASQTKVRATIRYLDKLFVRIAFLLKYNSNVRYVYHFFLHFDTK